MRERERIHPWGGVAVRAGRARQAWVAGCLLALAGCTHGSPDGRAPEPVAVVNGEPVTQAELRAALVADARDRPDGALDPEALAENRRRVLDGLIDHKLLAQSARAHGIRVADEEVERAVLRLRADYPGDAFDELLAKEGLTRSALSEQLRGRLLVEHLFEDEVFSRVAVTDEEIDAWIAAHPDETRRPEQVHAAQIVVKTEAEAKALLAELRKGADFGELARAHSLSPDAKVGGDLGWFARGQMPPPFDEVCFKLRVGRTSGVVSSSFGFHLFKLLGRRKERTTDPAALRREAEARLRRDKEAAAQGAYLARLRSAAELRIDDAALARVVVEP